MAMTAADMAEPVIASSNRYADIEPYVERLFEQDPQQWIKVLPWHFPQTATKEQEEEFLRRFFSEREIRMQGGADPPGNGFRFLKQVWYSAAIWNSEYRLPAIVKWWFENNQELWNDHSMVQHFFNEDVQPSTFFQADEIKTYGVELLGWAVKMIQAHLRPQSSPQVPVSTEGVEAAQAPSEPGTVESTPPVPQQPTATTADQTGGASAAESIPSIPMPVSTAPLPTAPVTAGQGQGFKGRNFSSGSHPSEDRPQSGRRNRGQHSNKRNSFNHPRPVQRPPNTFGDHRHMSNSYSPYGPLPPQLGPMPPGSAPITHRLPSGGPVPSPVGSLPTLPQGQQFQGPPPPPGHPLHMQMPPPYGQPMPQMQPQQQMMMHGGPHGFNGMPHGGAPSAYMQPQPFVDRSNVHPDSRNFSANQQFYAMDEKPDYRNKRRDSVQSRAGRGRGGYGGSMRGRGSRGRNSFSTEGPFIPGSTPSETNASLPQHDRRFSIHREKNWRRPDGQVHGQGENSLPQDARYATHEYGAPGRYQMLHHGPPVVNSSGPRSGVGMPQRDVSGKTGDWQPARRESHPCTAGCTAKSVSETCQDVPKLIVFNVPTTIDMDDARSYFSRVGTVLSLSDPIESNNNGNLPPGVPPKHHMWLQYADADGSRQCLANNGAQWPGGHLLLEVAKNHWDPNYVPKYRMQQRPLHSFNAQPVTALPPRPMHELPSQQMSGGQREGYSDNRNLNAPDPGMAGSANAPNAIMSNEATPTTSGVSTPNKKGKNKYKNRKKKKELGSSDGSSTPTKEESEAEQLAVKAERVEDVKSGPSSQSSLEGQDTKAEEDTPLVLDPSSSRNEDANVEVVDEAPSKAVDIDEVPSAPPATEPVTTPAQEQPTSPKVAANETVVDQMSATSKQDEDQNEDSFHTASGSPGAEIDEGDATTPIAPVAREQDTGIEEVTASTSDIGSANGSDSILTKESTKSPSPSKGLAKAPVPRVPSQKNVTIAVPPVDTEKAKSFGKVPTDSLQVLAQRSASGNSEATTPAFVTAPSTPAVPDPAPEPRSKKAPKQKGPEQTESFSIFAKPKRKASKAKDKKAAGKRKGSVLDIPDSVDETVQGKKEDEKLEAPQEDPVKQDDAAQPTISVESASGSTHSLEETSTTKSEVRSPRFGNLFAGMWMGAKSQQAADETPEVVDDNDANEQAAQEKGAKAAGKKPVREAETTTAGSDTVAQPTQSENGEKKEQDPDGLGITLDQPTEASNSPEPAKKKGNKGNKKKKKKAMATAEVTEMSHPGVDNHASTSNFEYKGNDVDSAGPLLTNDQGQDRRRSESPGTTEANKFNPPQDKARHDPRATGANISDSRSRPAPAVRSSDHDFELIPLDPSASESRKIEDESSQQDNPSVASSKQKLAQLAVDEKLKKEAVQAKIKETEAQ